MNHVSKPTTQGFTLIELMLSMTFIAILLLAIAMTILQIGTIYNKGMTVKDLNQSSRTIADDLSRTIGQTGAVDLTRDVRAVNNNAVLCSVNAEGCGVSGRLCLGTYTYIWNTAAAHAGKKANVINKFDNSDDTVVNFLKVPDPSKLYCAVNSQGNLVHTAIRPADKSSSQELLPPGDHKLQIMSLKIPNSVTESTTNQTLYNFVFYIGAGEISAMNTTQTGCLDPSQGGSDLTYCSVQQFTLALRSGNKVKL